MLPLRSFFAPPKPEQVNLAPTSTPIPDLTDKVIRPDDQYCAAGGFGDVFRCRYMSEDGVKEVAVKAFRFNFSVDEKKHDERKAARMIRRELGIWRRLNHRNIVPFLGIAYGFGRQGSASLVSLWMPHGTLHTFLEAHADRLTDADRLQLLLDIANGLSYLHSFPVVHGDLSSNNVLFDHNYNACLTDFGVSSTKPGTLRWAAPEHFSLNEDETKHTIKSDIYSLGNLAFLVLSGKYPWSEVRVDAAVVLRLSQGLKPARPPSRPIDDQYWALIEQCWSSVPERPNAEDLVTSLQQLLAAAGAPSICGSGAAKGHISIVGDTPTGMPGIEVPSSAQLAKSQEAYTYKAKTLNDYTATNPNELSFAVGETLDVLYQQGEWWQAKKSDGTTGIVLSRHFQITTSPDASRLSNKQSSIYGDARDPQHDYQLGLSLDVGNNNGRLQDNSLPIVLPPLRASGRNSNRSVGVLRCASCKVTSSPEWRKGPSGKKELCNACGLRYARLRAKKEGHVASARRESKTNASATEDNPSQSSPIAIAGPSTRNYEFSRASSASSFGSVSGSDKYSWHSSTVFEPTPLPRSSSLDFIHYSHPPPPPPPPPPPWGLHNEGRAEFRAATTQHRKTKRLFTSPTEEDETRSNMFESLRASEFASSPGSASGSGAYSRHSSVGPEPPPSPLPWSPSESDDDAGYLAIHRPHRIVPGVNGNSNAALPLQTSNADGIPKRPMNAFMIFARQRRPQVAAENTSMRTGEVSKILSREWNGMNLSEKQFYLDQAKILKDDFNQKHPDYVYKMRPNGSRKRRRPTLPPSLSAEHAFPNYIGNTEYRETSPVCATDTDHHHFIGQNVYYANLPSNPPTKPRTTQLRASGYVSA